MKRRLLIALCCFVLLVNILPIVPMAEAVEFWEIDEDLYYCRGQLEELPNGKALLFAYDSIVAGIDACAEEIIVGNDKHKLSLDEFKLALEAVRRDHTEQFWLHTEYSYFSDGNGNVTKIVPRYLFIGEELEEAKVAFNQAIDNLLARLTPDMSEYEIEKALHDLLAIKVDYIETDNAHNAYGALVEGEAVCEGYAEALQCLLQRAGIQSVQVYGESKGENHAWNMVLIEGKYYLVDLTWNDQDTILLHAYFNQTSEVFDEDHTQWRVGNQVNKDGSVTPLTCEVFDLPECTATDAAYFKGEFVINTYTVDSIAKLLKENNLAVSVFVGTDIDKFERWFSGNVGSIATRAGVTGVGSVSYNFIVLGREAYIYITTCDHKQLERVAAKPATCNEDGNTAYYICKNEKCGKWFADSKAKSEIISKDSVKILAVGHALTVKTESNATLQHKAENCTEHDTYYLICSVCRQMSDVYTFKTDIGAHNYSEEWVSDGVAGHKRVCTNGCGINTAVVAHSDEDDAPGCDVCGYKFSLVDIIPGDVDTTGSVTRTFLDVFLSNPLILGGGGGGVVLLAVIIFVIKKFKG